MPVAMFVVFIAAIVVFVALPLYCLLPPEPDSPPSDDVITIFHVLLVLG